jgi:hypothetical protein
MPTARELLEQADALMRRNRGGEGGIPVLTEHVSDALGGARPGPSTRERAALRVSSPEVEDAHAANAAESEDLSEALDRSLQDGVEPPVLTDVVEEVAVDLAPLPSGKEEDWLGPDTVDPELNSITGASPDTLAMVPPVTLRSVPEPASAPAAEPAEIVEEPGPPPPRAAGSAPTPVPAGSASPEPLPATGGDERWRALAEQVSMQVLQRLDLFVDTGLKAQLAAHLQPIVARAGTELVEAINDHVGQLVRSYVAEAIEREIAQWRDGQR